VIAPTFSIITPTILRATAQRTIESVDAQIGKNYEHLVVVDGVGRYPLSWMSNPRRRVYHCPERHNDSGSSCRAWVIRKHARGEFVIYVDDDDYLMPYATQELERQVFLEFGVYPVLLGGEHWLRLPPGECRTPTCGMWHKRKVGEEILAPPAPQRHYTEDSRWAGELAARFGHQVIEGPHLAVVERGHNSSNLPGGPPMVELPSIPMEDT
jgi:hypothetical protein